MSLISSRQAGGSGDLHRHGRMVADVGRATNCHNGVIEVASRRVVMLGGGSERPRSSPARTDPSGIGESGRNVTSVTAALTGPGRVTRV